MTAMSGNEVRRIRYALERALGFEMTVRRFGILLGLQGENTTRTVRRWETEGPRGPGTVALMIIDTVLKDGRSEILLRSLNFQGLADDEGGDFAKK